MMKRRPDPQRPPVSGGSEDPARSGEAVGADVTPEELDRERLRTYIDWAEVRAPAWYWPAYAAAIAIWLSGYELGMLWGSAGALFLLTVAAVGIRVMATRGQVSMPRFRGMPAALKRAYLPVVAATLWLVGVLMYGAFAEAPSFVLLGVVTGVAMALGGAWSSRLYRIEARRLAAEAGIHQ